MQKAESKKILRNVGGKICRSSSNCLPALLPLRTNYISIFSNMNENKKIDQMIQQLEKISLQVICRITCYEMINSVDGYNKDLKSNLTFPNSFS